MYARMYIRLMILDNCGTLIRFPPEIIIAHIRIENVNVLGQMLIIIGSSALERLIRTLNELMA